METDPTSGTLPLVMNKVSGAIALFPMKRRALAWVLAAIALSIARVASAETIEAPVGGKPVALGEGRVGCGPLQDWVLSADGVTVKPPALDAAIGRSVDLRVAPTVAACASSTTSVTLVATAKWPTIDPSSITLAADEGRLDLHGHALKQLGVRWQSAGHSGDDLCVAPQVEAGVEHCAFAVGRGSSADTTATLLSWFPAGGRTSADVALFDATGRRVSPEELVLRPARTVLRALLPEDAAIDLAAGDVSRVPLAHPEAVASVDCGAAHCELAGGAIAVRSLQNVTGTLSVKLRLAPHVVFARGDKEDAAPVFLVSVLPCSMSVASGDVLRDVDDARLVVRLDARCSSDVHALRFSVAGRPADVVTAAAEGGAEFVLLRAGRVGGEEVSVSAARQSDGSALGVAHVRTRAAPQPRAVVELPGQGVIDFIPNNRPAFVRFASPGPGARLILLPSEDVYDATVDATGTHVRGLENASGYVALRFGYRVDGLPAGFASTDLGVVTDPLERPIREANVPAAMGASAFSSQPIVELVCGDGKGASSSIPPGKTTHIPFAARDTCRLVLHKDRVPKENGAQYLNLEVDVTRVDGTPRPEAHMSQPIVLRAGADARYSWIKGVTGPFDRVTVRLAHAADEAHYVGGDDLLRSGAPSAQWSVIAGTGHARIYGTTAIPTGLYRVSDRDHSGILSLNFGVVMRLTWLDGEGHAGFLGLETGVMGVGLANDVSSTGHSLTQLATVTGVGLSVPIANRSLATETSINLHAWMEYEVSRDLGGEPGNPLGFVFGPSISIGNVGANL